MGKLPHFYDENLLVGLETSDDAAVYKVSEELALIQTVDFFTPVVDDPYLFGQIAAANALSDIYAMGGEPKLALNIVGFPNCLDPSVLEAILAGGADKVKEAGAILAGGHSIQDDEPKYGLSVTGFVHPDRILKNYGCRPGDALILTKQVGSGIINTAAKAGMAPEDAVKEAGAVMASLNKKAKEAAEGCSVHACTDVTGFGLLGHCLEMARASQVTFDLRVGDIAFIKEAAACARMGLVPAGAYRNREYCAGDTDMGSVEEHFIDLLCDPQTSGGLLFSVEPGYVEKIMDALEKKQTGTKASVIGTVSERRRKQICLHP